MKYTGVICRPVAFAWRLENHAWNTLCRTGGVSVTLAPSRLLGPALVHVDQQAHHTTLLDLALLQEHGATLSCRLKMTAITARLLCKILRNDSQ